jgi:O-antigen ligase
MMNMHSAIKRIGIYLMPLALVLFGLDYHAAKTLIHLSAFIALVILVIALFKHRFKEFITTSQPRLSYSVVLILAAAVIYLFTLNNSSPLSIRMIKNFSIPALCFSLLIILPSNSQRLWNRLKYIIPLSAITMSIPGIYDYGMAGYIEYRTGGMAGMPIIYASNLSLLAISAFVIAITHHKSDSWRQLILAITAYTLAISAIIFSGSRGPLISVMVLSISILVYLSIIETNKKYIFILIASIIVFSLVIPNTAIGDRLAVVFGNISEGKEHTSLGIRLEMWKAAIITISNNLFTGVGIGHHDLYFVEQLKSDPEFIKSSSLGFVHLHNDVINIITWIGVPAGLIFLFAFWFPLYYFGSIIKKHQQNNQITITGISVVLVFILNGMTNTPATRALSVTLFFLIISLLIYCIPKGPSHDRNK